MDMVASRSNLSILLQFFVPYPGPTCYVCNCMQLQSSLWAPLSNLQLSSKCENLGLQRDSLSLIVLAYCHSWGLSSLSMACVHIPHSYLCWSFPLKPKHTPKYTLPHRSASGEHNVRQQTSLRTNIYRKLTFSRPTLAIANILSHWLPPKRYISTILTLETLKL